MGINLFLQQVQLCRLADQLFFINILDEMLHHKAHIGKDLRQYPDFIPSAVFYSFPEHPVLHLFNGFSQLLDSPGNENGDDGGKNNGHYDSQKSK